MCGFIGYFSHEKIDLKASAKSIIHRGPDQQNISGELIGRLHLIDCQ